MSQINMQLVKELRDRTQAGLNDCKSALAEAEGNMDKAVEIILKKGLAKSAKRAGAVAAEGIVLTRVAADKKSAVIVEVNIQTDFAARNEDFLGFADKVAEAATKAKNGADLLAEPMPGGTGTVEDNRAALVGRLGENITVRRWQRIAVDGPGAVTSYVHMGGKIAVLLALRGSDQATVDKCGEFAEAAAMQVAAMAPPYLKVSDLPEAERKAQAAIFEAQLAEEGKIPAEKRAQVVDGKVQKWAKEICLLEQPSVMDPKVTVDQAREAAAKAAGGTLEVTGFVRFERGEGIELPQGADFAAEVAAMAGGKS
jgi:elongation factor Ts